MANEISKDIFLRTMKAGMHNITDSAECVVDIWDYARELYEQRKISKYGYEKRLIEAVYGDEKGMFHHILLFTEKKDSYVIIVVDVMKKRIIGHFCMDLGKEYGVAD